MDRSKTEEICTKKNGLAFFRNLIRKALNLCLICRNFFAVTVRDDVIFVWMMDGFYHSFDWRSCESERILNLFRVLTM